ncbi:MAG: MFS transporter [Oscillospiraceae bacterium]|nr:MFS transporter [Oscillospiraceae bacterium]
MKNKSLKTYLLLWSTQSLSALGSGLTGYALVLWLYAQSGSALKTALLSVCSYAPYVLMSIFAGALSDRWNKKKTMLLCDFVAALSTIAVLVLIKTGKLEVWHLYAVNALNGLMNTVQQPAAEVAVTMLIPEKHYQRTSGLRSFSQSLNSILTPVIATALFAFAGIESVIAVDLTTFTLAFLTLLFIRIPEPNRSDDVKEPLLISAGKGLSWLKQNPLILKLILFLAAINLIASTYDAALPAMIISKSGEAALGIVNACVGAAMLVGSVLAAILPAPKNRVRTICATLLISMSTENFFLAFGNGTLLWSVGAVLGWLSIPFMNANMDVIFRKTIPEDMQGRVYSCRNALQFFTIPVGFFVGGILVDKVFEPLMSKSGGWLSALFGVGKGSGAAFLFFCIGIVGVAVCIAFWLILRNHNWSDRE